MSGATYRPGPDVAWTVDETYAETEAEGGTGPAVVLARLPDGEPVVLGGSAGDIWLLALECHDADEVVARVAALTDEEAETVAAPVADLLGDLVERGLLRAP